MIAEYSLADLLFTIDLCRRELPANADPVHRDRLKSIERLLKGLLQVTPLRSLDTTRPVPIETSSDSPLRTWADFKRFVEGTGMRDTDSLAWINVEANNPGAIVVYDLTPGVKVVEQADDVIEESKADH